MIKASDLTQRDHIAKANSPAVSILCVGIVLALFFTFLYFYLMPVLRDPRVILPRDSEAQQQTPTKRTSTFSPLALSLSSSPLMHSYSEPSPPPPIYASRPSTPSPAYQSPHLTPQMAYEIALNQRRSSAPGPGQVKALPKRRNSTPDTRPPELRLSQSPCPVELKVQDVHVPSRALVCNRGGLGTSSLGLMPSIWKRSSLYNASTENVAKPF